MSEKILQNSSIGAKFAQNGDEKSVKLETLSLLQSYTLPQHRLLDVIYE